MHHFQPISTFSLASALGMLYISVSGLGAGLSASRRAWERVSLHEPQSHKLILTNIINMKKTIIGLLALGGFASAAITDGLQWAESFGDGYSQAATFTLKNAFYVENGVGVAGGSHTDSRVWTTNTGGKFTNAFTFSFKLVDFDSANWNDALSMYSNGTTNGTNNSIQLQQNGSGELMVYTDKFTGSNVADNASNINLGSVASLKGKVLTLVFDATGTSNTLTAYVDGVANSDIITFTYAEGVTASTALTGFQFGAAFGGSRASDSVTLDDIAVWNRALSAAEVASLPLTVAPAVPEPTTATLSLLALAGLAARRRRK